MSWTVVLFGVSGGALAAYLVARLMYRHQTKEVEPPPAPAPTLPHKIEVDVFLRPSGFSTFGACLCDECIAADLEFAAIQEELQRRMEQFDASRRASTEVDPRKLEYMRYLFQTGRLTDYF